MTKSSDNIEITQYLEYYVYSGEIDGLSLMKRGKGYYEQDI